MEAMPREKRFQVKRPPELSPTCPEYWMKHGTDPKFMNGTKRETYSIYLYRAKSRNFIGKPPTARLRNAAYTRFFYLRDCIMKVWDCTTIEKSLFSNAKIPQSEFKIMDESGKPMMTILAKKSELSWSAGTVIFDSYEFGKKKLRMEAVSNPQGYWKMIVYEELWPFIDDVKSIKNRLEGFSKPNTSILNLTDYAKCLGLQVVAGMDRLYLLEYNVLVRHDKNGMLYTDNPKFPKLYSFGQMCHILNLIAGKPEVKLPE